ncbi:homeobox-leucine zipper protein ROC4 [Oryza glaberrima]|uniref:homeobox-leucine zipper protein ROC4 n=1 Tax=Oryza glaberrima TaxID=4538 RepID=UPI00224C367B|nr:homeobox-leucine zipper protein ROC4 [Oryza glaberrima]
MSFGVGDHFGDGVVPAGMQFPFSGAGPGVLTSSPALSLALADAVAGRNSGGGGKMVTAAHGGVGGGGGGRAKARDALEVENEISRSGSDHLDVVSCGDAGGGGGDDDDDEDAEHGNPPKRKKRYHRHTPQQIQELEAMFKECPHPDEKQRAELSKRLGLEPRQVKFWFQNRRTQMKMQLERHENALLKQENDKLRSENLSIREATSNAVCVGCGGPAMLGEVSLEEHHLRVENARLKDELSRVCALAARFLGKSISVMAPPQMHQPHPVRGSSLELAVGGIGSMPSATMPISTITDFAGAMSSSMGTVITPMKSEAEPSAMAGIDKSLFLELAMSAMDELVKMAQMGDPLWIPGASIPSSPAKESLNFEEYLNTFPPCIGVKPEGYVSEASRESGIVIIDDGAALVETLMDERRWSDMFSCMIAKASTTEEISTGVAGSRNGALLLMQAELQVLSPLVPIREVKFLRFSKQLADGVWAVVDVSADELMRDQGITSASSTANMNCRRLPSGCVLQDTPNGFVKVTWVEHTEYDEASVHPLYRPLLRSGLALGAGRWIATLQRQCECLALLMSSIALPENDSSAIHPEGKRSMLKLARRMTDNFCAGVSTSSTREWSKLVGLTGNIGEDVHVMARKSVDEPGTPPGVVLSAATSVWMPVMPERLFNFLHNKGLRAEWDILSNGGPMQEVTSIAKGQQNGNTVCLLKASPTKDKQNSMLILQETCADASGSMVVYAPVDIPAMHLVMSGGDSSCVALLPSGFAILPAGPSIGADHKMGGSLLTVAFQILANSQPSAKLTVESVETVSNLISCTIKKIKTALHCDV